MHWMTAAAAVTLAAQQVFGATLDRRQTFWRQEMGCFWFSTREL
jgi:hypothetical protein